jgi:hypothetical protein
MSYIMSVCAKTTFYTVKYIDSVSAGHVIMSKRYDLRIVRNESYLLQQMRISWVIYVSQSHDIEIERTTYLLTTTPQFETLLDMWYLSGNTLHIRSSRNVTCLWATTTLRDRISFFVSLCRFVNTLLPDKLIFIHLDGGRAQLCFLNARVPVDKMFDSQSVRVAKTPTRKPKFHLRLSFAAESRSHLSHDPRVPDTPTFDCPFFIGQILRDQFRTDFSHMQISFNDSVDVRFR